MPSIRDIIREKAPRKKRHQRAFVCIDAANWHPYLKKQGIRIDWAEFKGLMEQLYDGVILNYYAGMITKKFYKEKHPDCSIQDFYNSKERKIKFFRSLEHIGYKVIYKHIATVYDSQENKNKHKCNFDVEITIDALAYLDTYDVLVLCTGDGDFVALLRKLKAYPYLKQIHVISVKGRMNKKLKKIASSYDYLDKLLIWVQDLKQH